MKRNSGTLGFLPKEALRDYLENGCVLGKIADNGEIAGYLLYAKYDNRFRIIQLCVARAFRRQNIARELIDALKGRTTTQKFITLRCRRDFLANKVWPQLGFFPVTEKIGRSLAGHMLVQWHYTLAQDDQLDLFQEKTSSDALDVVIDAHILFNLHEPGDIMTPSQSLYENYSEHSFFLQITEETYTEINRSENSNTRQRSRSIADTFPKVKYDARLADDIEESLKNILPKRTKSEISDIRQLAIAASSETKIFVTEDSSILRRANDISHLTGLQILSPAQLIIQYETRENRSYSQSRAIGDGFSWERITDEALSAFPYEALLAHGERKRKLREKLEHFLSMPRKFECDLLRSHTDILAIRVVEYSSTNCAMHLARIAQRSNRESLESFLVADTIRCAVKKNIGMVTIETDSLSPNFAGVCQQVGFRKCNGKLVKFCLTGSMSRDKILPIIRERCHDAASLCNAMSDSQLEGFCSPVDLVANNENYYLVPIKTGYAMSLIDRSGTEDDLIGGKSRTLLRWDNVYYRSSRGQNMLKPSSRILWYASTPRKKIMAVSRLDRIEVETPGVLFKKYRKFGILDWLEIYRLCGEDVSRKIMALQFSHTFPLRHTIPLDTLRKVYREDDVGLSLQSISRIPVATFRKLYRIGFESK